MAFTVLFRLSLSRVLPHPEAASPDELSYLLGADIFVSGHLAMPPHPYWRFFEMIHALSQPVYAPKYPPGQAAMLAIGKALVGDPFYGALLSVALLAGAMCWMLQAFVRPAWALLGGSAVALYFGAGHYWTESYWGGAVAALGAAVLIGACGRMRGVSSGILFGTGVLILLCSRPYEGGVLIGCACLTMLFRRMEWSAMIAAALATCASLAMVAGYNHAVTGSALKMPYRLHMEQYSENEPFWFAAPLPKRTYVNPAIAAAYELYDYAMYKEMRDLPFVERLSRNLLTILTTIAYDGGIGGLLPLIFVPLLFRDSIVCWFSAAAALLTGSLLVEVLPFMHYMAPFLVVATALSFIAIDRLWRMRRVRARDRMIIVAILCAAVMFGPAMRVIHAIRGEKGALYHGSDFGQQRAAIAREILSHPGDHLVFVRWSPAKPQTPPWVANGARIDAQRLVWAYDRGSENRDLLEYFKGRHAWLLEDDDRGVRICPYN
jgi:hypothetical protein